MRFQVKAHYDSKSLSVECFYIGSRDGLPLAAGRRRIALVVIGDDAQADKAASPPRLAG